MKREMIDVRGRRVELLRGAAGEPVVYLHGVWDIHSAQADPFPFHQDLATRCALVAPAHPGCGETEGIKNVTDIEDLAFHYFDVLDALKMEKATIVGFCLGGWIAAEMAVRNPERVARLVLMDTAGLQMPDALIADLFMYAQHRDGGIMQELRELLFRDGSSDLAQTIIPDGRSSIENEIRRYKSLTLAGRVGWEPPYLHNKKLRDRLHRIICPSLLVWGKHDRLIPIANAKAWRDGIPTSEFKTLDGSGHSPHIEEPEACLALIEAFLTNS